MLDIASFLAGVSVIPSFWLGLNVFKVVNVLARRFNLLDEPGWLCMISFAGSMLTFNIVPPFFSFDQILALPANWFWLTGCILAMPLEIKRREVSSPKT